VVWAQQQQRKVFSQAWVFIAVEIAIAIPSMMQNLWTMLAMKGRQRSKLRLLGNDVPNVDVFITCCGEDDRLVLDTVLGACEQDYPTSKFRVIVLDDAKSKTLQREVAKVRLKYGNVYYMARTKYPGVPHHFKSGNLNYGLEEVRNLPGGAAEYMAALDADMVRFRVNQPTRRARTCLLIMPY
jgi:cellulose synthase/poly-beta-1,6-N-acetylglucosamine synthase-like glycosyltransferase